MNFYIINHDFLYECEKVTRLFLPFEKFEFLYELPQIFPKDYILTEIIKGETQSEIIAKISVGGKYEEGKVKLSNGCDDFYNESERLLAVNIFNCLFKITNYKPMWGILTGIRPAGLLSRIVKKYGKEEGLKHFREKMLVSEQKAELCNRCLISEQEIISKSQPDSFSLYVSIPFCPSRCYYCSFVSHSVESAKELIPKYIEYLCKEIEYTAEVAKKCHLKLRSVYIGGGTPTSVTAEELATVMQTINKSFDLRYLLEYTVEAGRPDTITLEKLQAIKQNGATRISINPQTMNDDVLKEIGRKHSVEEFIYCYKMAREVGFLNINTDLIAGLKSDTYNSFINSVEEIIKLNPESVTIHALSVKRAAALTRLNMFHNIESGKIAELMVSTACQMLENAGILPYYMYRQGKTVGNLENIGYAKKGFEGVYNIYIMDETHTILACGASATTKLKQPNGNYIERIFNYKYPYEYLNGFDVMLERKKRVIEFYDIYGTSNKQKS